MTLNGADVFYGQRETGWEAKVYRFSTMFYAKVSGKVFRFSTEASRQAWMNENADREPRVIEKANYLQDFMATHVG